MIAVKTISEVWCSRIPVAKIAKSKSWCHGKPKQRGVRRICMGLREDKISTQFREYNEKTDLKYGVFSSLCMCDFSRFRQVPPRVDPKE